MNWYAIYDETGKIIRRSKGSERSASIGLASNERIYWGGINPNTEYLPGGVPTPLPVVEEVVQIEDVKRFMARLLSYTDGYVTRRADTGQELPAGVQAYRDAVRQRAHEIEAMQPIPVDYQDAKYWPEQL